MTRKVTVTVAVPTLTGYSDEMHVDVSADKLPDHFSEEIRQIVALVSGREGSPDSQVIGFVLAGDSSTNTRRAEDYPDAKNAVEAAIVTESFQG